VCDRLNSTPKLCAEVRGLCKNTLAAAQDVTLDRNRHAKPELSFLLVLSRVPRARRSDL